MGLMDATGLQSVALQGVQDLRCARARHAFAKVDWSCLVKHLNQALAAANLMLPADKHVTLVQMPPGRPAAGRQ